MFRSGSESIDFQPSIEKNKQCSEGFEKYTLNPVKKCGDRFRVEHNGTLVLENPSLAFQKSTFDSDEYCFLINPNAKDKYHHFPEICKAVGKQNQRMR